MSYPFDPDWVIAPGETLHEWLSTNGLSTRTLAAGCGPKDERARISLLFEGVLNKKPITEEIAALLARGTSIPAKFWLALEHNYRAGLAAGKKDASNG